MDRRVDEQFSRSGFAYAVGAVPQDVRGSNQPLRRG
jgi:hypothetical protein